MRKNYKQILLGISILLGGLIFFTACVPEPARKPRKFVRKECLDCHTKFADKYFKMKTLHPAVKEKKCESCHLRHGIIPKLLLKEKGNQICYGCHQKEKIGLDKPNIHTGLKKGQCTSCHNPHASPAPRLLKAEGQDVCYQCHKREAFQKKVVHKALQKEPCLTCHLSHGSDQPDLLKNKEATVCMGCHDSKKASFKKAHAGYPVETSVCNTCHNPHSSVKPKLLRTSAHPFMVKVSCEKCHNPAESQSPFEIQKKGRTLCLECHKTTDLMAGGDIEHLPFKEGKCNICHNPHASEYPVLLARPGKKLCFECHQNKNVAVAVSHKALESDKGCLACHVRHAAKTPKLLATKEEDLCFKCHEKTRTARQTLKPHAPFLEGKCSACHNSHGSKFPALIKNKMDTVCFTCHVEAEIKFVKTNTHKPVTTGQCNACHKSHGSDREKRLLADASGPELCAKCHGEFMKTAAPGGSNHEFFKTGKCLRCHESHGSNIPGMLVAKQGFLCFSCHGTDPGKEVKTIKSKHAPVVAGECTRCHSPHKAKLEDLLLAVYPDLCLICHLDLKKNMFPEDIAASSSQAAAPVIGSEKPSQDSKVYIHAPSDLKNCKICHKPHFSEELALINRPIQPLCGECHDYKAPPYKKAHLDIDARVMDCRKCHVPHTAGNPKFFKKVIHKPFAERACKDCHIVKKP